jgi:hypothetical protein
MVCLSLNDWYLIRLVASVRLTASKSGKILTGRLPHHRLVAAGGRRASAHTAAFISFLAARMCVGARKHGESRRKMRFRRSNPLRQGDAVLYTIAVVLIILWALGLVSSYTMGGFIHVLLVVAVVIILLRVISGRSPV